MNKYWNCDSDIKITALMFKSYTLIYLLFATKLLPNLIKDCRHFLSDNFIFSKTEPQLTQQLLHKIGSRRIALISLEKMNGYQIRQIWIQWITMCGARCWNVIRDTRQSRPTLPSWRLLCWRYEMICHSSSLIRQSYHFARDFDHVLLHQLVDILNSV